MKKSGVLEESVLRKSSNQMGQMLVEDQKR